MCVAFPMIINKFIDGSNDWVVVSLVQELECLAVRKSHLSKVRTVTCRAQSQKGELPDGGEVEFTRNNHPVGESLINGALDCRVCMVKDDMSIIQDLVEEKQVAYSVMRWLRSIGL